MRGIRRTALALAVLALAGPSAAAAKPRTELPSRAQAAAALEKVKQLRAGRGVRNGRELTPALAALSRALPVLDADDRRSAEAILARPDDSRADPPDTHKWNPVAPRDRTCGGTFCIHWVKATADAPSLSDSDADQVPDYVEQMLAVLEGEVQPCQNGMAPDACAGSPGLGWRSPASDGDLGGDSRVDVYIQDLFANEGVYGYVARDPGQPQDPAVPHHGYMVMDKDYTRYGDGSDEAGRAAMSVTAAHEYNHILQNNYDYLEDPWMFEATSVYMEEELYPEINDYLDYVKSWAANPKQPLTTFTSANLKPYGSGVWNFWLAGRFGPGILRTAWEQSVPAGDFAPGAYGAAIGVAGGGGFSEEFARFSAAAAEWNTPSAGFPDHYADVQRDGSLPVGTVTLPFALPHTTFALFDVPIPADGPPRIRVTATLPEGTTGAVALVARRSGDPTAGDVTTQLTQMPAGGTAAAELATPAAFGRITAVIVNSDVSKAGFDPNIDDYVFTRDASGVVATVAQPGPPVPVTGAASNVADHSAVVSGTVDPHMLDTTWSIEYGRTSSYGSSSAPQQLPASTVGSAPVSTTLPDLKSNTTYHYRVVARNETGAAAGADMTLKTAVDVTAPALTVSAKRQKIRTARTRGARYLARCSERCIGRAELRLTRATARALRLPRVIGRSRAALDPLPKSSTLRVRLSPRARRRLAGHRRSLRATLYVRVADEGRNFAARKRIMRFTP